MAREFNAKANRTNLHLSVQCRKQIAEIREAAAGAGELKPTVAAVIGEGVAMLYAQREVIQLKTKQELLAEARRINDEIRQIFIDADHWNSAVKESNELPIDPDPDGKLRVALQATDIMLGIGSATKKGEQ